MAAVAAAAEKVTVLCAELRVCSRRGLVFLLVISVVDSPSKVASKDSSPRNGRLLLVLLRRCRFAHYDGLRNARLPVLLIGLLC